MSQITGSPVALLVFIVCALALLGLLKNTLGLGGPPAPVAKRFLTDRELAMLVAIERILPAHRVHAQVANRGHDYQKGRYRPSPRFKAHPLQGWILGLSALLTLIPMYGAAKQSGWIPDLAAAQSFPESGSVTVATSLSTKRLTSWLEVQTSNANAVVQLIDPVTREHVLSIYVAGDDRVRVPVPRGTYQMRLIGGQKWHGPIRFFGPNTSYETVVKPMTFERTATHIIDLRRRPDGNLHTRLNVTRPEPLR